MREVEAVLARDQPGDILFVGHGGVGTLLYCHYSKVPISRQFDQPGSGGNFFTLNREFAKSFIPGGQRKQRRKPPRCDRKTGYYCEVAFHWAARPLEVEEILQQ